MKRILTGCLSLGAVLAIATTAEAQDTTQTGAAPMPQDSAPTTQSQGDTLGGDSTRSGYPTDTSAQQSPGYRSMESDSLGDSTRIRPDTNASDSASTDTTSSGTAAGPETTLPGDRNARQPETEEQRIHGDSATADSSSSQ